MNRTYFQDDVHDILSMLGKADCIGAFSDKKLLLTGAGGFLGRWVLRTIDALNDAYSQSGQPPCSVMALDSVATEAEAMEEIQHFDFVDFVHHDLRKGFASGERFDYVMHLAGIASPYWYERFPLEAIDVAVNGSRLMLEKAREDGAKYLFTSTSEVYATPPPEFVPTPEHYIGAVDSLGPRSCYDISKLMGETLAYTYAKQYDVKATVVRLFNAFGVGLKESDHRILPRMASAMKSGRLLRVFAGGYRPTRTYSPAANTVAGILLALVKGGLGPYNIGAAKPEMTVPDLAALAQRVTGKKLDLEYVNPPALYASEPMRRCPDITKAHTELGYEPTVTLIDGLERFFRWSLDVYTGEQ